MVICICEDARDRQIKAAIRNGAKTIDEIRAACGAGSGCGSCHHFIEKILRATSKK